MGARQETALTLPTVPHEADTGDAYCGPGQHKYVLIVAILASGMGFLDGAVVSIAVPQIRASLNAGFGEIQWVQNAYILFLCALMLLGGAAGDRYGLRKVFATGIAAFALASLLCAIAPTVEMLIAARCLQGAGAAIMIPGSMALISINTPRKERGRALGIWVSASSITAALGPIIGGPVLDYGGDEAWRWIFAINLPIGLVALFLLLRHVRGDKPRARTPLDWLGACLITISLAFIAGGLTALGDGQDVVLSASAIGAGIMCGAIALFHQYRTPFPMINLGLFRSRVFSGANILTLLVWSGLGALLFYLPMLLIIGWKLPATYAGYAFGPFALVIALLAPRCGRLADRYGTRSMLTLGPIVVALAHLCVALAIAYQKFLTGIVPSLLLLGVGMALCATPLSTAIMNSVEDMDAGSASGINNMLARLANLLAIAGLGGLLAYIYALMIRGSSLPLELQDLMHSAGFGERLNGALYQVATIELQEVAMNHAMVVLCLVTALLALMGALVGWMSQPSANVETS